MQAPLTLITAFVRRPSSAIFVQYGPAPDLKPLHTSSLNWKTRLSGTCGAGGRVFEFPFAHHLSRDLLGPSYFTPRMRSRPSDFVVAIRIVSGRYLDAAAPYRGVIGGVLEGAISAQIASYDRPRHAE